MNISWISVGLSIFMDFEWVSEFLELPTILPNPPCYFSTGHSAYYISKYFLFRLQAVWAFGNSGVREAMSPNFDSAGSTVSGFNFSRLISVRYVSPWISQAFFAFTSRLFGALCVAENLCEFPWKTPVCHCTCILIMYLIHYYCTPSITSLKV